MAGRQSQNIYLTSWPRIRRTRNAFSAQRGVLSVVLSKQYVDVRFQRGAGGLLLIPLTLRQQGLPQRVGLLLRNPASRIGPCYKLSIHSHLQSFYFCSLVFSFALLAYFSALFTSRNAGDRGTLHYSPYRFCVLLLVR